MTNIPKTIHYVWGYRQPKPIHVKMCIASWATLMPDYKIIEWNESTLDYKQLARECVFFKESLELKLWAYVADYIRFKVLNEHGGIYFDVDVQSVRRIDCFLRHDFFAGFHYGFAPDGTRSDNFVEGAVMGSTANHPFLKDMLLFFQKEMHERNIAFLPYAMNEVLEKINGTIQNKGEILYLKNNTAIYPPDYLQPFLHGDEATNVRDIIKPDTHTIHWFRNSYAGNLKLFLYMEHRASPWYKRFYASLRFARWQWKRFWQVYKKPY